MAAAVTRRAVLAGYRRMIRASRIAFVGDAEALAASRVAVAAEFRKNQAETDPVAIETMIRGIDDAHDFLLHNVIQGSLTPGGNYNIELEEHHGEGGHIEVQEAPDNASAAAAAVEADAELEAATGASEVEWTEVDLESLGESKQ